MNRGETVPFLKESTLSFIDVIEIDLNFSLDYKLDSEKDIVGEMLNNIQSFEVGNSNELCTLSNEDFLIQLCVHLFKEATVYNWVEMQRDLSLYKFCDIYAFLIKYADDNFFKKLYDRIVFFNLQKECFYSLKYTLEIYNSLKSLPNVEDFLIRLSPKDHSFLKQIIEPNKKNVYSYTLDFQDWLFCNCKKTLLSKVEED